jgi:hypothetical protein
MQDLILLVADKNMHFTLRGALSRPERLGIRSITYDVIEHSGRDGGVRKSGPALLALEKVQFEHALLVMDFEGSGSKVESAFALEAELDEQLRRAWGENAKAIVIEPELDIWIWGSDNAIGNVIGRLKDVGLRDWLRQKGFAFTDGDKPERPKEAIELLLRELRCPRSSAIYEKIAKAISLQSCKDPAFLRLRDTLRRWFPISSL